MTGRLGALLGIGIGLVLSCTAYGVLRAVLPGEFAIAALAPGLLAGIGARIGRAFGTPGPETVVSLEPDASPPQPRLPDIHFPRLAPRPARQ